MNAKNLFACVAVCALLVWGSTSSAATITYSQGLPLLKTNWTQELTVPKFDPELGTLQKVILELDASVNGNARFESLDPSPTTVTTSFAADVRLRRPDLTSLVTAIPKATVMENVGPYDGDLDFDGPSGRTYLDLYANVIETTILMAPFSPADAALFIGTGENVTLSVRAVGASSGNGSGNLVLLFNTLAEAGVTITYQFVPIPEPTTAMFLVVGVGCALLRRRRSR